MTTIFGGVNQNRQVSALNNGVDIVVACPGRLEDLMRQKLVSLESVRITVLDEADHMADLGFLPGVTRILAATPQGGQRLLFSATLDNGVDKLVKRFLRNPVSHAVDEATSPVAAMTHHVFHVADASAKSNWCNGWRRAPIGESCSCAPNIRPASWPASSPRPVSRQWICTATSPRTPATATWRRSPPGPQRFWWPPTSLPAVCTSMRLDWWSTSTRRSSTRPTCTARAHRAGRQFR